MKTLKKPINMRILELINPFYSKIFKNKEDLFSKYQRYKIILNKDNKRKILALKNKYKGEQCIIMATGPSLNKINFSLIKNHPFVFGTNGSFLKRNHFKYYFCSSPNFYNKNKERIKQVDSELFFFSSKIEYINSKNKIYIPLNNKKNISYFTPNIIKTRPWGPTVLLDIVIPSAIWLGFSEIILLGADYTLGEYKRFYDKRIIQHQKERSQKDHFNENLLAHKNFEKLKKFADKNNIKIYNCSPLSHLKTFEKTDLKKILKYSK